MMQDNYKSRLRRPEGKVDAVLDTDAFNEIDDQFALAYLLLLKEKINTLAVYAAPFLNEKSDSAADGMEKSFDEIFKVLQLMNVTDLPVFKGSGSFLENDYTPVKSDAALDLIARAEGYTPEKPLYVIAIGAITNIASALLIKPEIAEKIVVVWLGGNSREWPDCREFNWMEDVAADRALFASGVPVVQLPCLGVVDHLATTEQELRHWLSGKNSLCDYLVEITVKEAGGKSRVPVWSKVIWDVAAVAWLGGPAGSTQDYFAPRPVPQLDLKQSFDPLAPPIKYVYRIQRDVIFSDLFKRLSGLPDSEQI